MVQDWARRKSRVAVLALGASAIALSSLSSYATPAQAASRLVAIGPSGASRLPVGARLVGPLAGSTPITFDVVLKPNDPAALARFVAAVSTPGSPEYRHFIPKNRFASTFGIRPTNLARVVGALEAAGVQVDSLSSDHLLLTAHGSAAAAERAFNVQLARYRTPGGELMYAPLGPPQLPETVASGVQGVVGLDDVPSIMVSPLPERVRGGAAASCPTKDGGSVTAGFWTPDQERTAYDMNSLIASGDTGSAVRIAVVDPGTMYSTSDVSTYTACLGHSSVVPNAVSVDGGSTTCSGAGCDDETTADIETILGLLPSVGGLDVYVTGQCPANCDSKILADYSAAAADDDPVVTTSLGICDSTSLPQAEVPIFEEMASQGQSVFAASGDGGSELCVNSQFPTPSAWNPSDQPTVTAVGGTDLQKLGTPPTSIGSPPVTPPTERVWNDRTYWNCAPASCTQPNGQPAGGASTGGMSAAFAMPSYQHILNAPGIPSSLSSGTPCGSSYFCREVPDVSASADPFNGYALYLGGAWAMGIVMSNGKPAAVAGTSLAAPTWAAVAALIDSYPACGGTSIGLMNPELYELSALGDSSTYLNDITTTNTAKGNNDLTGALSGKFPVTSGYDMATGLGTPVTGNLAQAFCAQPWPYTGTVVSGGGTSKSSAFGTTLADGAVGAPGQSSRQGAVYAFAQPTDSGNEQVLVPADGAAGDRFGSALSGSAYSELAVGAPQHAGAGSVYVYDASGGSSPALTLSQEIAAPSGQRDFGFAIANEASVLVVGAPHVGHVGAADVYTKQGTSTTWTLLKTLRAPAGTSDDGYFGYAVAVDGTGVIVGDPGTATGTGSVYVYSDSGSRVTLSQTITAPDGGADEYFGSSLAQSSELAVGATASGSGIPAAYVYNTLSSPWTLEAELTPVPFAIASAVPGDVHVLDFQSPEGCGPGNVAIGMPTYDGEGQGEVYVYSDSSGSWLESQVLLDPNQGAGDAFGSALSSPVGDLLVGEPGYNNPDYYGGTVGGDVNTYGSENICP